MAAIRTLRCGSAHAAVRTALLLVLVPSILSAEEASGTSFLVPLLPQVVWAWITFGVVLGILLKTAWPVITEALHERARRIEGSLRAAEEARQHAARERERFAREVAGERKRIRQAISRMEAEIAERRAALLAEARAEAACLRAEAEEAIAQAKRLALKEVADRAVDLALAAAEGVLRERTSPAVDRRVAQEVIQEILGKNGGRN